MTKTNAKAAVCTAILWVVVAVCTMFFGDKKNSSREEYKAISLRLISSPVAQKEKKTVKVKPKESGSMALVKSMEQLMAENSATQKNPVDVSKVDWDSVFSQNSVEVSSTGSQTDEVIEKKSLQGTNSSLFGSAVKGYESENEGLNTAFVFDGDVVVEDGEVSSSTVAAIKEITEKGSHMASDGGKFKYSVIIDDSMDKSENSYQSGTQMPTLEGEARFLLVPEKPAILISVENEKLIDSSREVKISFGVLPSGQVDSGSIKIFPESLLPLAVKEEIKLQLAKWLFQPAFGYGQVCFKYNIMVR